MRTPLNPDGVAARGQLARGVVYALLGGACLSTGGLALRLVEEASGWQILVYRSLAFLIFMGFFLCLRYKGRTLNAIRGVGWPGVAVAVLLGAAAVFYVFAILSTAVANVVVILSVSPLLTALLGQVFLHERVDAKDLRAMLVAAVGIGVMFADGLAAGGVAGMFIAFLAMCVYAVMLVVLRLARSRDMLPATALSGVVTLLIAAMMTNDFAINGRDAGIAVFSGVFQFGLGFVFLTIATRHIRAALVALLSLIEVALAPLWVWLGVGETPAPLALVGGLVVLMAVLAQGLRASAKRS